MTKEFPRQRSKGIRNSKGYTVEARWTGDEPVNILGRLIGQEWIELSFDEEKLGLQNSGVFSTGAKYVNLLEYYPAEVFRNWFISIAIDSMHSSHLETRIVEHAIKIEYEVTTSKILKEESVRSW